MTRRTLRLFAPAALGAISMAFAFSVAAQPGGPAPAPQPAAGDAGSATTTADGGAPLGADGGTGAPSASADAGIFGALSSDAGFSLPQPKKRVELPPPSPAQVAALGQMQQALKTYSDGARDYKDAVTSIITIQYEEKKNAILAGLNREISEEEKAQTAARKTAIERLEAFVAKYSGANANEEATPDAMFRLGALYEERGKASDDPAALPAGLQLSVKMYKRILLQFPNYKELPAVVYFLGHALNDLGRLPEAQQVWRSLVCNNLYKYKPAPASADNPTEPADIDPVAPMPQDNTQDYWIAWRAKYYDVEKLEAAMRAKVPEVMFQDPYPDTCTPLPQPALQPGEEPKYVQELWFRIGEWEFGQDDLPGGVIQGDANFAVWDYNRAARAYQQSMKYKAKPEIYQVALYKNAWTLFKEQRYRAAVKEFLHVLDFTDELEKRTGQSGADFRKDSLIYVAGSLTQAQPATAGGTGGFDGPPADEPYIQRDDVTMTDPTHAEQILAIGIDRVQDPSIVPQDKPYTIQVYEALADEYKTFPQWRNTIKVYELILQKWPLDPFAPDAQEGIAEAYDNLARITADPKERQQYEAQVIQARTNLSKYVGTTEWTDANKDNVAALQHAEDLVHSGLKQAAAAHKQRGEAHEDAAARAARAGDAAGAIEELQSALTEFKLEATAWKGYLGQDETAPDAYDSRYFYAEALHAAVNDEYLLFKNDQKRFPEPSVDEINAARDAAIASRDSEEDDTHLDNAAFFVVDLSDIQRDIAAKKGDIKLHGEEDLPTLDADKNVVQEEMPAQVMASIAARDDYVSRVPANLDTTNRTSGYQYYPGLQYFVYGHFKDAVDRLTPIYQQHCGKDAYGYEAWKRLIRIANMTRDTARSVELARAEKTHSCAFTPAQIADEPTIIDPTIQRASYMDARATFEKAQKETNPDEKKRLFKVAAGQYEGALQANPSDADAPEAAMNAAYCYKQIGDSDDALRMYNTFISKYGSDQLLDTLKNGGPDPNDPKKHLPPDPEAYKERLGCLRLANEEMSRTSYQFFQYGDAAHEFQAIANNPRFDDASVTCDQDKKPQTDGNLWRQHSAKTALVLFQNLNDEKGMNDVYATMSRMNLAPDVRAEADYRMKEYDYNQWDPTQPDQGANLQARSRAFASLSAYFTQNRTRPEAAPYVLTAAYKLGKMLKTVNDNGWHTWFRNTVDAWNFYKDHPAQGLSTATQYPYNDYGAEADYTLIDEEISKDFDYGTGHMHYPGANDPKPMKAEDVKKQYEADYKQANNPDPAKPGYQQRLLKIRDTYQSKQWWPAANARIGSLYDSLRTALDAYAPLYFTKDEQNSLDQLSGLNQPVPFLDFSQCPPDPNKRITYPTGMDAANAAQDGVRDCWHRTKDAYMDGATQSMITYYAQAAVYAQRANVRNDEVRYAVNRLAFYTARGDFGDAKMRQYVEKVKDPFDDTKTLTYTDGMFLQWRNGQESANPPETGAPAPLPPAIQ